MKIYLTGFMGSGKSTYGKELSEEMGYSFVDLDERITSAAGMDIAEIFEKKGEEEFRKLESKTLLETEKLENTIIATGGGTPCYNDQIDWMNKQGETVYLKLFEPELFNHLKDDFHARPMLKDLPQSELLQYIYDKLRERVYYYHQSKSVIYPLQFSPAELALHLRTEA